MKAILSERNVVIILFVMVLVTFSLAQEDSKKMEQLYSGINKNAASSLITQHIEVKAKAKTPSVSPE